MTPGQTPPKPPDFDWVTARHECSVTGMFLKLRQLAKRDVETRRSQGVEYLSFHEPSPAAFIVASTAYGQLRRVHFDDQTNKIVIQTADGKDHGLTLTLTDQADCKLNWNGDALDPWQVLRRAL